MEAASGDIVGILAALGRAVALLEDRKGALAQKDHIQHRMEIQREVMKRDAESLDKLSERLRDIDERLVRMFSVNK